jgi:hypothetical protein
VIGPVIGGEGLRQNRKVKDLLLFGEGRKRGAEEKKKDGEKSLHR